MDERDLEEEAEVEAMTPARKLAEAAEALFPFLPSPENCYGIIKFNPVSFWVLRLPCYSLFVVRRPGR